MIDTIPFGMRKRSTWVLEWEDGSDYNFMFESYMAWFWYCCLPVAVPVKEIERAVIFPWKWLARLARIMTGSERVYWVVKEIKPGKKSPY